MLESSYYDVDQLIKGLRRTHIRRRQKKNEKYDKNYFPKAQQVISYTSKSPERFFWLLHPNQLEYNWFIELIPHTKQYNKVIEPFRKSRIQILNVFKISNRYLERQYDLKKEQKELTAKCQEKKMYHFTTQKKAGSIIMNNFNWRLSGESRGHMYGYGISFSPDPIWSEQFCKEKRCKAVFIVKVLISATHAGDPDTELPPYGFDTTVSQHKKVYVKFEDSEFYPEYLVYYDKAKK